MPTRKRTEHDRAEIRASFLRAVLSLDRPDGGWTSLNAQAPSAEPADEARRQPRPSKKSAKTRKKGAAQAGSGGS